MCPAIKVFLKTFIAGLSFLFHLNLIFFRGNFKKKINRQSLSFPRRRESRFYKLSVLDSRLRGNDKNRVKNMNKDKTIAVIGLGYVGLPLALLASRKGYNVIGIDINKEKISKIRRRISPFKDEMVSEELKVSSILASYDYGLVQKASMVFICVPTPVHENHMPNLEPVKSATLGIAPYIKRDQVVVLESTVNPGVCESVMIPLLENVSGLKAGKDFYVSHCPERINPGDKKWNVENINRVVGSLETIGLHKTAEFYESIITGSVRKMNSIKEAEAVKVVENSFRDINIAFVNELAQSFTHLGIDVVNVIRGASTKPFSFMAHYPGCGVGGHCIPVDPYYLIEYAKDNGFEHKFLSLARKINNSMPAFTVKILEEAFENRNIEMRDSKVAVLGLAYKADIDDARESPSYDIIKILKKMGVKVAIFDPYVPNESNVKTLEDAVKGAQGVILATAHRQFKDLEPEFLKENKVEVIVDGRNCLDGWRFSEAGIVYKGIGRNIPEPKAKLIESSFLYENGKPAEILLEKTAHLNEKSNEGKKKAS